MSLNISEGVLLAPFTTFKIGGPAKYFVSIGSKEELRSAYLWAKERTLPVFVLGGGSNILISDEGFNGLVIHMGIKGVSFNDGFVYAGAGVDWDDFVKTCVENNFCGLEALSGIPGTVGGAVVQNAGAYGSEVKDVAYKVEVYDTQKDEFYEVKADSCQFAYRSSVFKNSLNKIVVGAFFARKDKVETENKEVLEKLKSRGDEVSSKNIRRVVLEIRKEKSMLYNPLDPNSIGAGCLFTHPIISTDKFELLIKNYPQMPYWNCEGGVKLSAGWLVEQSGFPRGYVYKEGKVGLSQKHALVIVNKGNAKAQDVVEFYKLIQQKVWEVFEVSLEPEIVLVGFV